MGYRRYTTLHQLLTPLGGLYESFHFIMVNHSSFHSPVTTFPSGLYQTFAHCIPLCGPTGPLYRGPSPLAFTINGFTTAVECNRYLSGIPCLGSLRSGLQPITSSIGHCISFKLKLSSLHSLCDRYAFRFPHALCSCVPFHSTLSIGHLRFPPYNAHKLAHTAAHRLESFITFTL